MYVREIIGDAVRYPFSDWKKILIFGIIISIYVLSSITRSEVNTTNISIIWFLGIIGLVLGLLTRGYLFKIVLFSLRGNTKPPKFNTWAEILKNGIKVSIVTVAYAIPAILILLIFTVLSFSSNPFIINTLLGAVIWALAGGHGIYALIGLAGTWGLIAILYMIIITPITLIAIAYMADNDSNLNAAFRFYEILDKIASIGWKNLVIWYIGTGIVLVILYFVGFTVTFILVYAISLIHFIPGIITLYNLEELLLALIVVPYLYMYIYRSVALFYLSNKESLSIPKTKTMRNVND